jgi:hypothetical protein
MIGSIVSVLCKIEHHSGEHREGEEEKEREKEQNIPFKGTPPTDLLLLTGSVSKSFHHLPIAH